MKETTNINVNINTKAEKKKAADVPALVKRAEITIASQAELELASEVLKEVKARYKELDTQRKSITKPIDDAKKAVMELFKDPLELLEKAESKLKRMMLGYTEEQERKAREEQLRLQRLAEQEAEKEKKKLEAKIEKAIQKGDEEKAAELELQKEMVIPVEVPVIQPKVEAPKGVSYREDWRAEIVDEKLIPREFLIPNLTALNKIAVATKGSIEIPGVKFVVNKVLVSKQ